MERDIGELTARADAGERALSRMEENFTRLMDRIDAGQRETRERFEATRGTLDATQDRIAELRVEIAKVPTKTALFGYTSTVAALAFAIVGIFVGILAYLGQLPGQLPPGP